MAVRILLDARTLARSRFATSPAAEVVGAIQGRGRHISAHAREWLARAESALEPEDLRLLLDLIPSDHPNSPDFLIPEPAGTNESMAALAERIAATDPDLVDYHLDVALRGRTAWPHVVDKWPTAAAYEAWRRPVPPALQPVLDQGAAHVAGRAAAAMSAFFDAAISSQWSAVRGVLESDIAFRADLFSRNGIHALLADLGEAMTATESELVLERPYSVVVDWAEQGLLFVPTTVHLGPVRIAAEQPHTPMLLYAARGVGRLWGDAAAPGPGPLTDLLGGTRAALLVLLREPGSTHRLSQQTGRADATVSYHLGILHRAGLVVRTRRGSLVLYALTPVGLALLDGGGGTDVST